MSVITHGSIYGTRRTPCHSETQLSESPPNQANENHAARPPILLNPGLRGVLDHHRPASAHSFRSTNSDRPRVLQRPKREARKPPVSFRKPSSLLSTQSSGTETQYTSRLGANDSEAVSFTEGRERAGSMSSLSRRLSKDLLDAVDEFRPLDFRSRVQAAGARDYGEDVADRNLRPPPVLSTTVSSPNLYSQYSSGRSHSSQSVSLNSRTKSITSMNEHYDSTPRALSAQADHERPEFFTRRNKNRLSLNTYKPSGFVSPTPHTPRSVVTPPGHRGGMTHSDFSSPEARHEMWSRQYHLSPAVSNFSLPRSPETVRHTTKALEPKPVYDGDDNNGEDSFPKERQLGGLRRTSNYSEQRQSAASGDVQGSIKTAARFSQGTYRSSLASSVTSRNPSIDFTPLGYPRQNSSRTHFDTASNGDDSSLWRSQSLRKLKHPPPFGLSVRDTGKLSHSQSKIDSHRHSRSNSSGNSHSKSRTKSLLTTPSALTDLIEAAGPSPQPQRNSSTHDWALNTSSTAGSASSSSNGLYSGASGSLRPISRHTKSTSIDSLPRPPSSQSGVSASVGQHSGSGWSPTTTRSTGFNIDDYVSSDDDSFTTTTKKRPTAEGEEELLFKGSYGATGAELPGLLESMIMGASCSLPSRVVGVRGTSQLLSSPSPLAEEAEDDEYDDDAAEGPDINDVRPMGHRRGQPFTPPFSQTQHAHSERNFGGGKQSAKPRAQSNMTPSWLPSDDWVLRPGSRLSQIKRPTTSSSMTSNTGPLSSEDKNTRPSSASRGQSRLSAFGTLPLRNMTPTNIEGVKRTNGGASSITSTSNKEPATSRSGKEETDPAILAVRLRKEAKSRKREEEARTIREKRMTRAFGRIDEDTLAALEELDDGEMETRGRTRVRIPKGKSVGIAS